MHDVTDGMDAREVQEKIQTYYRNPHAQVTHQNVELFQLPVRMRLGQSLQSQRLLLKTDEIARAAQRKEQRDDLDRYPDIASFLQMVAPPPPPLL